MIKFFEFITEAIGFLEIVLSPLLIGLGVGFIAYKYFGGTLGIIIGTAIVVLTFALGILMALRKWKDGGTVHFLSKVSATPELDYPEDILVKAQIRLLSEADGGIAVPIRGKIRPNHYFGAIDEFGINMITNIGEITFNEEPINADQILNVDVRFYWAENIKDIDIGTKWIICFGTRKIGEGEILENVTAANTRQSVIAAE